MLRPFISWGSCCFCRILRWPAKPPILMTWSFESTWMVGATGHAGALGLLLGTNPSHSNGSCICSVRGAPLQTRHSFPGDSYPPSGLPRPDSANDGAMLTCGGHAYRDTSLQQWLPSWHAPPIGTYIGWSHSRLWRPRTRSHAGGHDKVASAHHHTSRVKWTSVLSAGWIRMLDMTGQGERMVGIKV